VENKRITEREYVKLAGRLDVSILRRDLRGTSWMLPDGRVVSEKLVDGGWEYYLLGS
jgi:hypothetical protein